MGIFQKFKIAKEKATKLQKYEALSKEELTALPDEDFCEALDLMVEFKVGHAEGEEAIGRLKFHEQIYYVLERYDAEVQNGGLCQFYVNSSGEVAPFVADALGEIGAGKMKILFEQFNQENGINVNKLDSFKIESVEEFEEQVARYPFETYDETYYSLYDQEPIWDLMLDFVRKNYAK